MAWRNPRIPEILYHVRQNKHFPVKQIQNQHSQHCFFRLNGKYNSLFSSWNQQLSTLRYKDHFTVFKHNLFLLIYSMAKHTLYLLLNIPFIIKGKTRRWDHAFYIFLSYLLIYLSIRLSVYWSLYIYESICKSNYLIYLFTHLTINIYACLCVSYHASATCFPMTTPSLPTPDKDLPRKGQLSETPDDPLQWPYSRAPWAWPLRVLGGLQDCVWPHPEPGAKTRGFFAVVTRLISCCCFLCPFISHFLLFSLCPFVCYGTSSFLVFSFVFTLIVGICRSR